MELSANQFFFGLASIAAILSLLAAGIYASRYWKAHRLSHENCIDLIDALLPQTQCGYCGYPGCRPYASAIANGDAINKCAPGGTETIASLAMLLDEPAQGLDPRHGKFRDARVAYIREEECIGCTKCIQACPVDAILGAAKLMHTVISTECNGCDLCVDPCPVDCIDMLSIDAMQQARPAQIKAGAAR